MVWASARLRFEKSTVNGQQSTVKHIFMGANRIASLRATVGSEAISASFYHSDHLGSSNVISNQAGNLIQNCEYLPYGQFSTNTGVKSTSYYFTGKELDDETGLMFYGARYYDPQIGRFITPDTIVQAPYDLQSLNRYSYCRNNPINLTDPTGHSFKSWFKKHWQEIVSVITSVVSIFVPVLAPVMWAVNMGISAYTAVQTGSVIGFAGGIVGGAVFGAIGKSLALGMVGSIGQSAWTFTGGAITGAVEFGLGGFGSGFGASLASGRSFTESIKAGAAGAAIGAVTGAAIQGSYMAGWQDSLHGYSYGEAALAQASGNLQNLPRIDSVLRSRTKGTEGLYLHGTDLEHAVGIAASGSLNDGSWVTSPTAIDKKTGQMAIFLNPTDYQRFTTIDPPKGTYFALTVAPNSSIVNRGYALGGAPQYQVYGPNKVIEVYANLNP